MSDVMKELRKYGFKRQNTRIFDRDNHTIYGRNLVGKLLNHTIFEHVHIEKSNFNRAAVTGSIFRHCSFVNNAMDECDFEYCEFYDCEFDNKSQIRCSFNNSSFINTKFRAIDFSSCTFTNAYFEGCQLLNVKIEFSTLENSCFKNCYYEGMDLRCLNMDFVEFDTPHMSEVVLPMSQIPFMYGCLEYLYNTKDCVKLSKGESEVLPISEYFEKVIPLMKTHFEETRQYFPLSNIYLTLKDYDCAIDSIKKGLSAAISDRDFRMLKYYSYLIAKSKCFKPGTLHMFYNNICKLSPQGKGAHNELKNYARHIGEIKAILFSNSSKPTLWMTIRTNLHSRNMSNVAQVLEAFFAVAKKDIGFGENQAEVLVAENSPLIIELKVCGEERGLSVLLTGLLKMLGIQRDKDSLLPLPIVQAEISIDECITDLYDMSETYCEKFRAMSVQLLLVEYYIEHFQSINFDDKPCYYYNSVSNEPAKIALP